MTSARNRGGARLAYTVLVASTVLLPRLARARDLTEILADKEVITLDEKKEATRTITKPTIVYKEGKGFTFATPDDRFSLSVGGRLQVRYTLTDIDSAFVNPQKGVEDSQSFDIPRARLWWKGNAFTPRLKYEIQIDVAGGISFYDEVNAFQKDLILRALEITNGHQSKAAKLLGMNTTTLNSKIKYFGIR